MRGINQVMSMVIAVVIAAALLYFGFKILGKSQQQVSGLTNTGDIIKACESLGINIKGETEDKFIDQIPAVTAKEIALIFKSTCNREDWTDVLLDQASKCLSGSGGEGCISCATTSGRCLSLKGTELSSALKACEALKYYYSRCESEKPNNVMSCLIEDYSSNWCSGTISGGIR